MSELKLDNGYEQARFSVGHVGGNYVEGRRAALLEGRKPSRSAGKSKSVFLEGLAKIDSAQLPPDKAKEFETITDMAKTGDWRNLDFLDTLNTYCLRFSLGQPITYEQEEGSQS